ncbi:RNA-binding transcriptional accessory protein [Sulfuriferula plumbiphila]|uniref:RNA-binding transcriptional accessory protein n=2 Tax=Sulfuriferula plumbiphila TaxID=171865 RepID=A0A512L457_9PROT|nr:RNA-binding transcriptional accessory protein [Sulfuriferula plumbiphila]GEP29254.1 RNA-binding transcriptional accessory protein [Sulfuriferula plumbiphila]
MPLPDMLPSIEHRIATALNARPSQVAAAIALLDEGASVPFISRYRKEATGGLDDTQMRNLEQQLGYLRELEDRRSSILASITGQGKLTPELQREIAHADTKQLLEDLYLPYRQKRRTKAQIAKEAGLEPLAERLLNDPTLAPDAEAARYVNIDRGVADIKSALEGARHILMERFGEDAVLLGQLRAHLEENGVLVSSVAEGKEEAGAKFRDYFDYREPLRAVPPHRALALFRGRNEDMLRIALKLPEELDEAAPANPCEGMVATRFGIASQGRAADKWLAETVRWTWRVKLALHLELDLLGGLRERAEEEAIRVFARNLHDLLLAAPAGPRATIGLDPGLRTGVKVAVVDATGKLLDTATIYPHVPRNDWDGALHTLSLLAHRHGAQLISIGNGTASRETDKLAAELISQHPQLKLAKVVVSEAGASVYSASEFAAREFPQLDVSLRGAVSIARRLQDPLAELVKIDPKSIGVGQYQHDVSQFKLARSLDAVVEDCVNAVGVDVNMASVALLARISGLSTALAENIVAYRDTYGAFSSREALKQVPRLGAKTFEQAAGFLRVRGDNPLDASAVHPEAYPLAQRILTDLLARLDGNADGRALIGQSGVFNAVDARHYTDDRFGLPTVQDILRELEKPGRDPRPAFKAAAFKDGVEELKDLQPGMVLEGVVTNVTNFGAFVDVGVHQDGLVHISALADKFVKDPHSVVKAGDVVKVKVLEVDVPRKRVALTMRLGEAAPAARDKTGHQATPKQARQAAAPAAAGGALADALARALRNK